MKKKSKSKNDKFYPVSKPFLTKKDTQAVLRAVNSGWVSSSGKEILKFEDEFGRLLGVKYSTTVSNGTAALEIALKSLNIKKGDQVIIPNFTIISNALAVIKLGAIPIYVDCELDSWNMNISEMEEKITNKTKAVIATHICNYPLDMKKIKAICKKKNIFLIEDAAEILGMKIGNKYCGSFGDISTFSFYSNKQITTGEGGMICTNSKNLNQKFKELKNLCFGSKFRFKHNDIGWNYRFTNIQAALGLSQLKRLKTIVNKKISIGKRYYEILKKSNNFFIPAPSKNKFTNIYWIVGLVSKNTKFDANKIINYLSKKKIESRQFFFPMHRQPILRKYKRYNSKKFPNSDYISKYGFYIPSYLNLKNKDIIYISEELKKI